MFNKLYHKLSDDKFELMDKHLENTKNLLKWRNENMKDSNPFYKERALSPLQDKAKTLKLSSEVLSEYENHFRDKYPKNNKLNDNQIITKLLIDYLNTQCLERKIF